MSNLVVITGPPHSGKSAVIEVLRAHGHDVVAEVALDVIERLAAYVPDVAKWRKKHPVEFQALITRRQLEVEDAARSAAPKPVFLDRALPDGLAFCRVWGTPAPPELLDALRTARYAQVFLFDLMLPFDPRAKTGRVSDESTARSIHEQLQLTWSEFGLRPTPVPLLPVQDRAAYVLERLQVASTVGRPAARAPQA